MPRWSVELAVGLLVPVALMLIRFALDPLTADRAPYALNFLAVLIAAVIGGWRSGLLALVLGQLLTWYIVVEPQWSLAIGDPTRAWGLAVSSVSQALLLLIIALYQGEVDKGVAERERRIELQDHARREIDHRIRNNLQTVLALIHLQSQRSRDPGIKEALQQISERIKAIASVTERLAFRHDLTTVSLRDHLFHLCEQLEQGLADGVDVQCDIPDVAAGAVEATYLGIIVNELVINALKHGFPDGRSGFVRVTGDLSERGFALAVRDNGTGIKAARSASGSGIGQRLVQAFVRELGGEHELDSSNAGTTHRIIIPELVKASE